MIFFSGFVQSCRQIIKIAYIEFWSRPSISMSKWPIIGPPAKRHSNGVLLADQYWPDSLCIGQGYTYYIVAVEKDCAMRNNAMLVAIPYNATRKSKLTIEVHTIQKQELRVRNCSVHYVTKPCKNTYLYPR